MSSELFKIRCMNCGHKEPDTWMGYIFPMTDSNGNTKCCGATGTMIKRNKTCIIEKI